MDRQAGAGEALEGATSTGTGAGAPILRVSEEVADHVVSLSDLWLAGGGEGILEWDSEDLRRKGHT